MLTPLKVNRRLASAPSSALFVKQAVLNPESKRDARGLQPAQPGSVSGVGNTLQPNRPTARCNKHTARASIDSPRPTGPSPSAVLAFTLT